MGHSLEHQTKSAGRLLVVGCASGMGTPFNGPIWAKYGGRDVFIAGAAGQIPLGRMSGPEEVARHVRFLPSDEASFLTGQVFAADGGEMLL